MSRHETSAATDVRRGGTPVMRPPRPGESRAGLPGSRRRPVVRGLFFALAAVGGFVGGEVVLLALAEPGALLPRSTSDRLVAFVSASGIAGLGGLLCAAIYRQFSRRR